MTDQHKLPGAGISQTPMPSAPHPSAPIGIPIDEGGVAPIGVAGAEGGHAVPGGGGESVLVPDAEGVASPSEVSVADEPINAHSSGAMSLQEEDRDSSLRQPYTPPSIGAPAGVRRNEKPLIIAFFTVAIAALLVVVFVVVWGLNALGNIQWSAPESTAPVSERNEYVEPQRGPVKPEAINGVGEGKYEAPTDLWLHPGYARGVSTWSASGTVLGVSQDKSTIVFSEYKTGGKGHTFTGYDVKTGTGKWDIHFSDTAFIYCYAVRSGIAYCTEDVTINGDPETSFISIDLATGERSLAPNTNVAGRNVEFIGYWQGYSYWNVSPPNSVSTEEIKKPHTLIGIKEGAVHWYIEIAANADCIVGDGAIGCINYDSAEGVKVEIINASMGEFVADFTGNLEVEWYRDGFSITNNRGENTESQQYSWTAKEKTVESYAPIQAQPEVRDGNLLPMPIVGQSGDQGFVDPSGASMLVRGGSGEGIYRYVDMSTNKDIAVENRPMNISGDGNGTVYLFTASDPNTLAFVDENGTEVFSQSLDESAEIHYDKGIVYQDNDFNDAVTVYAPQG